MGITPIVFALIILLFGFDSIGRVKPRQHAIGYAGFYGRSHDVLTRVYDAASNVIKTHEAGDFKEP